VWKLSTSSSAASTLSGGGDPSTALATRSTNRVTIASIAADVSSA